MISLTAHRFQHMNIETKLCEHWDKIMWTLEQNYMNTGTKLCEHWDKIMWDWDKIMWALGQNYVNTGTKLCEHWNKIMWTLGQNYVIIGTKCELWDKIMWTLGQNRNSKIEVDDLKFKKCCTYESVVAYLEVYFGKYVKQNLVTRGLNQWVVPRMRDSNIKSDSHLEWFLMARPKNS